MIKHLQTSQQGVSMIKNYFLLGFFALILSAFLNTGNSMAATANNNILTVYFTESGNTEALANAIHKKVGGEILQLKTVKPYPESYTTLTEYAKKELEDQSMPELATKIPNMEQFKIIFLGFPNWWSSVPMPIHTFAKSANFDGKIIAPFVTHGGGGLGHIEADLKKIFPNSKILKPLSLSGSRHSIYEQEADKWINDLGVL